MSKAIIIPARYESTRFPGKLLAEIRGRSMIEWVIDSALRSKLATRVIVATDDKRILDVASKLNNVEACMTSTTHKTGTDRIAEVLKKYSDIDYIVNLQGDEPLMPTEYLDKALNLVLKEGHGVIGSLVSRITNQYELDNSNIVKVVMDKDKYALYFSRSLIPCKKIEKSEAEYFRHIGIYAYRRETLLQFANLPQGKLEITEQLEQLRALENGIKIKLEVVPKAFPSVDNPLDVELVEQSLVKV